MTLKAFPTHEIVRTATGVGGVLVLSLPACSVVEKSVELSVIFNQIVVGHQLHMGFLQLGPD